MLVFLNTFFYILYIIFTLIIELQIKYSKQSKTKKFVRNETSKIKLKIAMALREYSFDYG